MASEKNTRQAPATRLAGGRHKFLGLSRTASRKVRAQIANVSRSAGATRRFRRRRRPSRPSAVDKVWAPMPRGAEAETTKRIDRPKFTGRPPGAEISRPSGMKAAATKTVLRSARVAFDENSDHQECDTRFGAWRGPQGGCGCPDQADEIRD